MKRSNKPTEEDLYQMTDTDFEVWVTQVSKKRALAKARSTIRNRYLIRLAKWAFVGLIVAVTLFFLI